MKTFSQIKTQLDEVLIRDIRSLIEHQDGASFRGVGAPNDFGRGGYDDPHHLSGRGQLLDVLIRKVSQLGVENDELANEVAERMGLDLQDGGVQKLLKILKIHALGPTVGDLPTESAKREVLTVATQIAAHDFADVEERSLEDEAVETVRAPKVARTPPGQTAFAIGDPLGYANQGNLEIDEAAIVERMNAIKEHYGLADLPELTEDDLQEDKTDRELKSGLQSFIQDARDAQKLGNRRLATQLRRIVLQVVAQKGLDARRIAAMLDEDLEVVRISLGEDITPVLKNIVANKQAMQIKFDNGRRKTIDLFTASALITVHDNLNKQGQEKFRRIMSKSPAGFIQMTNFAFQNVSGGFKADPGRLK